MSDEPSSPVAVEPEVACRIDAPLPPRQNLEVLHLAALRAPRNEDVARQRLLHACKHPAFASDALYRTPRSGGFIEGFSVRFAEEAARCWGNTTQTALVVSENAASRTIRVSVTDLERNDSWSQEIVIERNQATERVFVQKVQAEVSRAQRTLFLKLLPASLKDECTRTIRETMANADARDPDLAKKRAIDAMEELGVSADEIAAFLGQETRLELQPAELQRLRTIHQAIRDGQTTWQEVAEKDN